MDVAAPETSVDTPVVQTYSRRFARFAASRTGPHALHARPIWRVDGTARVAAGCNRTVDFGTHRQPHRASRKADVVRGTFIRSRR